jgi:hypothetical protein
MILPLNLNKGIKESPLLSFKRALRFRSRPLFMGKIGACKVLILVFISRPAASFLSCAVGPWVSVAGREAALARGNPAKKHGAIEYWNDEVTH